MLNGRLIQNISESLEYTSRIYRNLTYSMRIMENFRRRLPPGVVENDFVSNLDRFVNTALIIDLNCYLIQNVNHKHSIGTIINTLQNQRHEFEEEVLEDVDNIISEYKVFIESRHDLIESIIIMRDRGYAHIDTFERLNEAGEVDLVEIIDLIKKSEPILNHLREFTGCNPVKFIDDDDTIEEAFEILNEKFAK